jgi:hypothetical protein
MALSERKHIGRAGIAGAPAGAAAVVAAAAAIVAPGAEAGGGGERSTETFEGTCQFSGTVRQHPPLTNTPRPGRAWAVATGTCNGVRAAYFAHAQGTTSCGAGTATGAGFLRIRGARIDFRFSEVRGPGAAAIRLEGARGGGAAGTARVHESEDPVRIAEACGGQGLRQVRIRIDLATTPAIAG